MDKLDEKILLSLSIKQKEELAKFANKKGITLSAAVREAIQQLLEKEK